MTRLQKMLSRIKTVYELARLLDIPSSQIIHSIGVSKDKEELIPCNDVNCEKCALYTGGRCTSRYDSMMAYLNAELTRTVYTDTDSVKTTSDHAPIIKLRDSARELLKTVVLEGFKQGFSSLTVYRRLDEYIDVLEGIGLFEENELRTYVATDLSEVLTEERKKDKMREPELTPYEIIARNIKVKLALRVKGSIWTEANNNEIFVSISCQGLIYNKSEIIKDLNTVDSSVMSENIYKSYRKFIMKKFFTFD